MRFATPPERVLGRREMPGAEWFPGATLNYAEHAVGRPEDADEVAVLALLADPRPGRAHLGAAARPGRAGAGRAGRGSASAGATGWWRTCRTSRRRWWRSSPPPSLGAIWASCAPEFGARSVVDRFGQIEPTVLLTVAGYGYGSKDIDRRDAGRRDPRGPADAAPRRPRAVRANQALPDALGWAELLAEPGELACRAGAVRAPAVRAVLLRHHRQAEGDRALATAGSCSST